MIFSEGKVDREKEEIWRKPSGGSDDARDGAPGRRRRSDSNRLSESRDKDASLHYPPPRRDEEAHDDVRRRPKEEWEKWGANVPEEEKDRDGRPRERPVSDFMILEICVDVCFLHGLRLP